MKSLLRPALTLLALLSLLTGLVYPLVVAGLARVLFPEQAAGSIVMHAGHAVGSALIGQNFSAPDHFWGRLSAGSPQPYNALASGGSNLGAGNPALLEAVKARIDALHQGDPDNHAPVPVDLVTASASGLDPDISPAAAQYQAARVARARGLDTPSVLALVAAHTAGRTFGVFGQARVNVLALNLALDDMAGAAGKR